MIDPFLFVNLLTGAIALLFGEVTGAIILFIGAILSQSLDIIRPPFIDFL